MSKLPDIILQITLKELGTDALKRQINYGPGFWVIVGDTVGRYYGIDKIADLYPHMTAKQHREIARMIKRADPTKQVVISFHLPDGTLVINPYTIESE